MKKLNIFLSLSRKLVELKMAETYRQTKMFHEVLSAGMHFLTARTKLFVYR